MPSSAHQRVGATPVGTLTVRGLLTQDSMLGALVIAGASGLERPIARLNVMTVPDIVPWTKKDEFLLTTGYPLPRDAEELGQLVTQLANRGLAGLGIKLDKYLSETPTSVVATAESAQFPIVIIPPTTALDDVLSQAFETIVNRQAVALAKIQEIHDTFLSIAVSGGGLVMLVRELAGILQGASVAITDATGVVLATVGPLNGLDRIGLRCAGGQLDTGRLAAGMHADETHDASWAVAVIRAGALQHGFVVALANNMGFPSVAGAAVEQAALVAALEITRDLAVSSVERQFASNALHDLVTSMPGESRDAIARAGSFGWDLERPLSVLVARQHIETGPSFQTVRHQALGTVRAISLWTAAIKSRDSRAAAAGFATELVAVVGAKDPEAVAKSVLAEVNAATHRSYAVGLSQVGEGATDISRLYQEARTALRVGRRLSGEGAVTRFGGLGLHRLISNVGESELRSFLSDTLGPVLDLPEPLRVDLLHTLSVLLDHHFNVAESARTLHYHYNTMRYRIGKLERLLGNFVDDSAVSLRIGVALQILRMREISGDNRA